jgi:hypothetical protein
LPHIVAIVLFMIISIVYFYPSLEGKVLHSNDGTVAQNSAREINDFRNKTGLEALWTNSMFGGMPAYLISVKYKGNLMVYVDKVLKFMRLPAASIFITMAGFYLLLLFFGVEQKLAIAGAIAYGFSTYFFFILTAGHNTKAFAIAYMAPMIGAIYYTYWKDAIKGALLTTLFLTLELMANHPQITYYSFICILIFIIAEFIQAIFKKQIAAFLKTSAILIVPVILAVGMNLASLYTTYEYGKYSLRGRTELVTKDENKTTGLDRDYVVRWSYGIDETFTLLVPNFKGGGSIPFDRNSKTVTELRRNNAAQYANQFSMYWGTQPGTNGPVYIGAVIIFLFILGLIVVKGHIKWWLLIATVLSIMLAWGKNFMPFTNLFLDYFPGYNKFRAVTMTLVIAEFCIPLLGILALRDIFNGTVDRKEAMKGIKIALGFSGGFALLFLMFPGLSGSFVSPAEQGGQLPVWLSSALIDDRKNLLRGDALRSLVLILLGAVALLAFFYEKLKKDHVIIILGVLFLFDMWFVDKRYLNADNFMTPAMSAKVSAPTHADSFILRDTSNYRVFNLAVDPFNDASTSLYHKSIGGYHGAKLRRYQELIDSLIIPDLIVYDEALRKAKTIDDLQPALSRVIRNNALNMLNTKYIILDGQADPTINPNALGNAWFVESPLLVANPNEEISATKRIDPARQAAIDIRFKRLISNSAYPVSKGDTIYLSSYKPNELHYRYSASGEKLAIFSEIYYPEGWKAYIDGKESDYFRADYVLRGLVIPPGNHEVKFVFHPSSYFVGTTVSMASSLIFLLMIAGYVILEVIKKPKTE